MKHWSTFLTLLWFLLRLLGPRRCQGVFTHDDCERINASRGCSCERDEFSAHLISCSTEGTGSMGTTRITVERNQYSHVYIDCAQGLDVSLLPRLNFGRIMFVELKGQCMPIDQLLQQLNIQSINVVQLKADDNNAQLTRASLSSLPRIPSLSLKGFNALPVDVFEDYSELPYLEIEATPLVLPVGVFKPLKRLIGLGLRSLPILPPYLFDDLSRLAHLQLTRNGLRQIHRENFKNLLLLRSLHLTGNTIAVLPENVFSPLKQLTVLYLNENKLRSLPSRVFEHQTLLKYLYIAENHLEDLPDALFTHNTALQEIDLSNNRLSVLPPGLFNTVTYLSVLKLNDNLLKTIAVNTFANNVNLQYLYLDNNDIYIERQDTCTIFKNLTSLIELHLRNNSIVHLNSEPCMKHFSRLDLSYNKVNQIYLADLMVVACSSFKVDLSHNQLQILNLASGNTELPEEPVKCRSEVNLSYNPLHCDCKLIDLLRGDYRRWLGPEIVLNSAELTCASPEHLQNRSVRSLDPVEVVCPLDCPLLPCQCSARPYDATMVVNCSYAELNVVPELIPPNAEWSLQATELHLTANKLRDLPLNHSLGYANVTRLFVSNNLLDTLTAAQLPGHLSHLDLSHNQLERLNSSVLNALNDSRSLEALYLSHNPWVCDCKAEELLIFIKSNHKRILDVDEVSCGDVSLGNLLELEFAIICPPLIKDPLLLILSMSLLALSLLLAALYYKYQMEVIVWLYAHNLCLCCVTEEELDRDKHYDAFVSYSHKDEYFVEQQLLPGLENEGPISFKICTHSRDWVIGAFIPQQIVESVERSRRTIIVLSQNFIESAWALMEFRTAHQCALNEGRSRVLIIVYGEIKDMETIDTELKAYLKMNTYLKWGDPWFWKKLRYAMPHSGIQHKGNIARNGNEPDDIRLEEI